MKKNRIMVFLHIRIIVFSAMLLADFAFGADEEEVREFFRLSNSSQADFAFDFFSRKLEPGGEKICFLILNNHSLVYSLSFALLLGEKEIIHFKFERPFLKGSLVEVEIKIDEEKLEILKDALNVQSGGEDPFQDEDSKLQIEIIGIQGK